MREANVKLKNRSGEDVTFNAVSTITLDGDDGNKKTFSLGALTTGNVELDFSEGNHLVLAPDDKLYDKVVIFKPATLAPENIAQGIIIAGIEGTFEGAKDMPVLNAPSISRSSDTITISNPSSNGNFNKGFNIYANNELAFYQTGTTFSLVGKLEAEKDYKIESTCVNPLMTESSKSGAINLAVYSITKDFDSFISTTDTATKISNGLKYSIKLNSAFGYWLPELIKVYKKNNGSNDYEPTDKYTYSMYTGEFTIDAVNSNIKIEVEADEEPQIKRPSVKLIPKEFLYITEMPKKAQRLLLYDCDVLVYEDETEENPISVQVEGRGATYSFVLGSDGYYQPQNRGVNNSYAICRISINNSGPADKISLLWMQSSEQNYDYGMVGKIDTALSLGSSADSNLLLNAYGQVFTTPQTLVLDVPSGSHFYDIKYRKDGSVHSGWDMFEFKVDTSDNVLKIATDTIRVEVNYLSYVRNADYEEKKSANVTHHIYLDDELIIETKEGI